MHDNLVKRLRADADYMDSNGIMLYAVAPFYRKCADAIEELSKRVPKVPHGRLIDADALMKQVEHDAPLSTVYEKTMRRYLNNAPTIIPAEEGA